jgi:Mycothiol maleylpyruvate isomerase N-terminal domain
VIDRTRLLADEDAAWSALTTVFELVPEARFEEPSLTPEGWSPKDAMFHIAGWMEDCAVQLARIGAGSFDPAEETRDAIELQNERWFRESRATSATEVRERFPRVRRRMLDELAGLAEVTPDAAEWFEESGALHYAKHVGDLETFVSRAGS